ncbi:DUF2867 domain-containing protein [Couchioplanes azureus]|uniref:DUF2867 domain-containing protein n=1 Tax=Couchioplanes caeruleus TaxID=56438 RepID=UPI0019BC3B39|nr:DUF2867 domain-containing protein [Couchioplanes caeruleus]GGQ61473.1 hypothetical protein GCM10010166_33970 [Couchioplanes caeruleus subsp. azureus]
MTSTVHNVHERELPVPAAEVGRLLDRLGAVDDPLWPAPAWLPVRFDRPLAVGADGGHGGIRYHVTGYHPGRRVELTFHPHTGLTGTHTLEIEDRGPHACVLRHRLTGRPAARMRLLWPAVVRVCHDTVIEHLLDNAERAVTGTVRHPVRYPWRARLAVGVESVRVRAVPVPAATLLEGTIGRPDLADAFALRVPPGTTTDPQDWADAVFRNPPRAVVALLRLRNRLVAPFGIERGDESAFATITRTDREVLLGTDAGHLDFRAGVLVEPDADGTTVTVSTLAATRSPAGRAYLAVVRLVHPLVVRAMLRHAGRTTVAPWRSGPGRIAARR